MIYIAALIAGWLLDSLLELFCRKLDAFDYQILSRVLVYAYCDDFSS